MIPATMLTNALLVGAVLFCLGLVGILTRRNLIVMFLSAELMLQGVSVTLVAWSRYHGDWGGAGPRRLRPHRRRLRSRGGVGVRAPGVRQHRSPRRVRLAGPP